MEQLQSTAKQDAPNAGYVVVKEWGVRFKPVSGLDGLEYVLKFNNARADFTTQQIAQLAPSCNASEASGASGIGSLGRYATTAEQPINATLLTTINGYSYYYGGSQAPCADSSSTSATVTTLPKRRRECPWLQTWGVVTI